MNDGSGMMDQDAINNMLSMNADPEEGFAGDDAAESDMSFEPADIDAASLESADASATGSAPGDLMAIMDSAEVNADELNSEYALSADEIDILGEIGNICMGAAATTLFTLFNRPVSITTPTVKVHATRKIWDKYDLPFVAVAIGYIEGVMGKNVLLLKEDDVRLMTSLLMGGDGEYNKDEPLEELHLSAISEIMNQMMGASSTSLASLINRTVNITPPEATIIDFGMDSLKSLMDLDDIFVNVGFQMEIEGLLKSELFQMMSFDFAKQIVDTLMHMQEDETAAAQLPQPPGARQQADFEIPAGAGSPATQYEQQQPQYAPPQPQYEQPQYAPQPQYAQPPQYAPQPQYAQPPQYAPQPQYAQPPQYAPQPQYAKPPRHQGPPPEIQAVQYTRFDEPPQFDAVGNYSESIALLSDVPLQVSVELGRAKRSIREILDFNIGSLIVLDKLSGEQVDVMVNGKLIAKGEVVVIDESYGVRITEIITPSKRLSQLT